MNIPIDENRNPDFDRVIINAIIAAAISYLVLMMCSSCATHKVTSSVVSTDSVNAVHIEKTSSWANVCMVDTFVKDRLVTIVLNDKGDTIKQKEYVYVRDNRHDIIDSGHATTAKDSLRVLSKYDVQETITKDLSWWQRLQLATKWFVYGAWILGVIIIICLVYNKLKSH